MICLPQRVEMSILDEPFHHMGPSSAGAVALCPERRNYFPHARCPKKELMRVLSEPNGGDCLSLRTAP